MKVDLADKISFVNDYFGESIKCTSTKNGVTRIVLQNMNRVDVTDTSCINNYKIVDIKETADVSVDYRDYILDKYIERGETHNCRVFCKVCMGVLDTEQQDLSAKLLDKRYGGLDKAVFRDRLQDINQQRIRMNEFAKEENIFEQ